MIWHKDVTDEQTGLVVSYWTELELQYDMLRGLVFLRVGGFASLQAIADKKQPVLRREYLIPEGTNPELGQAGRAFLNQYARSQPEFVGSETV